MLELGKVVPVVPVVMKADTMTIREAAAYRQEVYDKIHAVRFDDHMGDFLPACPSLALPYRTTYPMPVCRALHCQTLT